MACGVLALSTPAHAAEPTPYQRALAAGYKAAFLCSGMFNAGRTQAQIEALELTGIYAEYDPIVPTLPAQVDAGAHTVSVAFDPKLPPRRAEWHLGLGCTTMPIGAPPQAAVAANGPPAAVPAPLDPRPWPLGDAGISPRPGSALARLADQAFAGGYGQGSRTVGVLVVRDGKVIAERYGDGFGPTVSNRTWSVAKSISGTLVGIAAKQGLLDPAQPARVPEWGPASVDPRTGIKLDNLLRMASGLHSDTAGNRTDALYTGATTVTGEVTHWPLEAMPGTRFRYANNDILLAIRSLRAALNDDQRYLAFPRTELFDRIGMTHTVAETDWQGNFILSSQVWSTARDLARLGLLWLNDGVWQGERILPEGWVKYMTTPSGPQPEKGEGYGATMWLFGPAQGLPAGSYAAQGNRGQYIMVIPSERLVVVRRGEDPVGARFDIAKFSADVAAALR
ncbi:putative hydrolase [Sphingomonas changbaiensis NBRC 104936]|uniref:Putative hydrolase n=1 Tax=Sphingomonas changbaiensis NBRC 104936 TaxID=1219043 RepID=A0A0E9MNZ7_9SPHN|nr:serine hydrolase [Sphingomonas changbaiensis]GAO39151.1 putative hydrolase [Sphingomonas changbaiensis NBRC 104936]